MLITIPVAFATYKRQENRRGRIFTLMAVNEPSIFRLIRSETWLLGKLCREALLGSAFLFPSKTAHVGFADMRG